MATQSVTFLVPSSSSEPMVLEPDHSGLRMVLVSRESVRSLGDEWRTPGIYFLLGPSEHDPDRYRAYVGEVGRATLIQRVRSHARKREWWNRALLVTSSHLSGFDSAEIGWLEGRLYDVLNNAVACEVMNGNRPGDDSLPAYRRDMLERYVEPIMAVLRACGASPDTADQKPQPKGRKKMTVHPESVADLLRAGLLKPDTVLHPLKSGVIGTARVVADGRLEVDGHLHSSLSGAAKAVTGTSAESGWLFWGAPSGDGGFVPLATLRERLREGTVARLPTIAGASKPESSAAIVDLVLAAGLALPLELHATYRGREARAVVERDGSIVFGGVQYASPSSAGRAARLALGYAGGRARPATNGWTWWTYVDVTGAVQRLDTLRQLEGGTPEDAT